MSNIGASDSLDSPLSDEGKRQAELLGIAMQNIKFDKIYSSHLIRAVQTAAGVLKHQKNPPALEIVPELAECGYPPQASADEDIIRGIWQDVFFHGKSMMDFESDYDRAVYCIDSIVKKNAYHSGFDSVRESVDGVEKSRDINMLNVTHGR
ncbi:MAG: histidine phosphatase family protein [Clostridia bacterium]|nr:histidine phosphatase family protein [Clostridia bacterium]